jgi:hypothetical protein
MAKIIDKGLAPPEDPIYKEGWTTYIGPQQKKQSTTPTKSTPQKSSEETKEK